MRTKDLTDEQRQILDYWKEAGLIDATDMWPFDKVSPKDQANRRKKKQQDLLTQLEEALL